MKTRDFAGYSRNAVRPPGRSSGREGGFNIGAALLGVACAVGVLGVLAVLYHFG